MGVFGAVFDRRGDAGFKAPSLGASSGVVGFNVATLSCLVREKVRPAWPGVGVSAKKFALRAQNGSKLAFCGVPGEFFRGNAAGGGGVGRVFSRTGSHGIPQGKLCCAAGVPGAGGPGRCAFCPVGRAAVCAGGRRPAREPSALRASLGASSRSPARPATAHGHRSQALRMLRRPPYRWRSVCRYAQWAGPGLVVDCYALSAAGSSPVTSPCTLGW